MTLRPRSSGVPRGAHALEDRAPLLFVDDDRSLRRAFARSLRGRGFAVEVAATAAEALRRVQARRFAVVVTDLLLPGISGESLVHELDRLRPAVPVLVVTGKPERPAARRLQAGSNVIAVLGKPWDEAELVRIIGAAVERHDRTWLSEPPAAERARENQVLVVDGDLYDAELVEAYLTPELTGKTVGSLEQALSSLHREPVGAIVTALRLPDATGVEVVMRLHAAAPEAAIITIGGDDAEASALTMIRAGAQDHFTKDELNPNSLLRTVKRAQARLELQRHMSRWAQHDDLTGLARRGLLRDRVRHALARARRRSEVVGLLSISLDVLHEIERRDGPWMADTVLCEVASRLHPLVREYDLVARHRSHALAVLVDAGPNATVPSRVAARVKRALSTPVEVDGRSFELRARIGLSQYPQTAGDPSDLIQEADTAALRTRSFATPT